MSDSTPGYVERLRAQVGHAPLFMPSACCAVLERDADGATRVLLQQRGEPGGPWGLPGGAMELGETVSQAAVRETRALGRFALDALPEPLFDPHRPMLEALVAGDRGVWD